MIPEQIFTDADLGAAEFSIVRKTWTVESGVPELIDLEEIFACGIIHPADPARLDLLPEESRHDPIVLIHSTEPLSLGERADDSWTSPDEILCQGHAYRVLQVREWQSHGFWKAWAVRLT